MELKEFMKKSNPLTRDQVKKLGFYEIPHFTVMGNLNYDLGRNRLLSIGCVGTPNECLFIGQAQEDKKGYEDLVCLHNYDYDGYITIDKLKKIISGITGKEI